MSRKQKKKKGTRKESLSMTVDWPKVQDAMGGVAEVLVEREMTNGDVVGLCYLLLAHTKDDIRAKNPGKGREVRTLLRRIANRAEGLNESVKRTQRNRPSPIPSPSPSPKPVIS